MARGPNRDGTVDVRVELVLKVNPQVWAEVMMADPEALVTDVRRDIKRWVRDYVKHAAVVEPDIGGLEVPIADVRAPGIYDSPQED